LNAIANLRETDRRRTRRSGTPAARKVAGGLSVFLRRTGKALALWGLCSAVCFPLTATADDMSDMKQALKQLQEQNQTLMRRITALEAEQAAQRQARARPAQPAPAQPLTTAAAQQPDQAAPVPPLRPERPATPEELERRVRELEITKTAQEDATRSIIKTAVAKSGPRINEFLSLSGALEVIAGRTQDFSGIVANNILLNTAELDFDIKAGEWIFGSLILGFDPGLNPLFPTSQAGSTAGLGIDRITVDRATVTIGDPLRFPLFLRGGRDVIPFGTSTGFTRTSGLSIESPLTIQAFETRTNLVQIGFEFPTPALTRAPPPVVAPPIQPLVVGPLVNQFAHWLGYHPSGTRPPPLGPLPYLAEPAPFYGTVGFYQGTDLITGQFDFTNNVTASLGYRARGHCGRPYSELTESLICPWAFDASVDFASSIFASNFLRQSYAPFLNQIGNIPALAANLRGSFGPFSLIAEYNTALTSAGFTDGLGNSKTMLPSAWQVSLGYQFGWNPWVEKIGDQGTFVSVGYSQSQSLAGATQLISSVPTRVGFVPKSRLLLTAGEWVLEGLKLSLEGSIDWDYPLSEGGTGATGWGALMALTFTF
jgi:hypothetical protein